MLLRNSLRYRLGLLLLVGLGVVGCSRQKVQPSPAIDQAWAPFLASVSTGEISRRGPVRLRFVEPMVDSSEVGKEFQGEFKLDPDVKGSLVWESTQELVFKPNQAFKQGAEYIGRLSPKGLRNLPKDLGDFVFRVTALRQNFEVVWNGFTPMGGKDSAMHAMEGLVTTTDIADSTELARFMVVHQGGQSRTVSWTSDATGHSHAFKILDVRRVKERSSVKVAIKPSAIGMDEKTQEKDLPIPGLDEFDLLFAKPMEGATQGIHLQFTDPISLQADLPGLVRIAGMTPLRFDVQGGRMNIYLPRPVAGTVALEIDGALTTRRGATLGRTIRQDVSFELEKPGVRFIGQGVILPDAERLTVPFEATSLHEVTVEALQVYASNMGQFLQVNTWTGERESRRVGRFLWRKRIRLVDAEKPAPMRWTRYAIDVTDLLKEHPGSLFRLRLSMSRPQSAYPCEAQEGEEAETSEPGLDNWEDDKGYDASGWDGWSEEWNGEGSTPDYANPCTDTYFAHVAPEGQVRERNLIASNIGLIAKAGADGKLFVATTNLRTADILPGVEISAYNFQNQSIGTATTDGDGFAHLEPQGQPFYLRASKDKDIGYLKVNSGSALPVSHFDVGGVQVNDGVKGFFYGERGVWRPGDSLFLTLAIEDRHNSLPKGHPIRLELRDPQGRLFKKVMASYDPSGFHVFRLATDPGSPTGTWMAIATLGDRRFEKPLKIETVKPNRLDVQLKWNTDTLWNAKLRGILKSQWLHGGSAAGLRAEVSAVLTPAPLQFGRYADFVFSDPSRSFSSERQSVFEGQIGGDGSVAVEGLMKVEGEPASALKALFNSQVFEEGGDASSERTEVLFHPYDRYVGIKVPKGDEARNMLRTDTTHLLQIAVLDPKGKVASANKLHATLTKIQWKWWWEKNEDSPAEFQNSEYGTLLKDTTLSAPQGKAVWPFRLNYPEWGRYFLRVCDEEGGHCTGQVIYMDWPGWAGRAKDQQGVGASMLSVGVDKPAYKVGETALLTIPSGGKGRALVSLETGSRILRAYWVETKAGSNRVEIPLESEMTPVVYAHVSLVQPHEGRNNDLPLRLYGIVPLKVEDPSSRLTPMLDVPKEVRPGQPLQVHLKEAQGRAMTYTVAVVDEGLLGLTRFKTPDPLQEFRQKEALGVKTWDLFDWVVGAYGGQLERLLSLGGDEAGAKDDGSKVNRFPPLVRFYGPFRLEKGKSVDHSFDLPEYVGRVRVMVVAGSEGSWGAGDAQVFVRKPLMILPTLPRVVRPGEEIEVPVSVFAMKDKLGDVEVSIDPGALQALDGKVRTVSFARAGESMVRFRLKAPASIGRATVRFQAKARGEMAASTIQIGILTAGLPQVEHQDVTLAAGESWKGQITPLGVLGTQKGWLEISTLPRLGLESRLQDLIGYPYGCLEQTTSKAFPQMLLPDVMQMTQGRLDEIRSNVKIALRKLQGFLQPGGGFGYWPGAAEHDWSTLWVGHFLIEASLRGYEIPGEMLPAWKAHQKTLATRWWNPGDPSLAQEQAYRLFLLALGNEADLSAMNRLRGTASQLPPSAKWMLGAAYALSGQMDAAASLTRGDPRSVRQYTEPGPSFGSPLRDQALAVYALTKLGRAREAQKFGLALADSLGSSSWQSTQATAWTLLALANAYSSTKTDWSLRTDIGGKLLDLRGQKTLMTIPLEELRKGQPLQAQLTNRSKAPLYLRWVLSGTPAIGQEKEESKGISLDVSYTNLKGEALNPSRLTQGTQFLCRVNVSNSSPRRLSNLALTQILPSGWEIHSARMDGLATPQGVTFQDIRDDRVKTYFDLEPAASRRFPLLLSAAYAGKYQLPGTAVEAMYDAAIHARTRGSSAAVER